MKKLLATVFLMIAAGNALASPIEPSDNRMVTLQYNESDVYTITTKYGYETNILFGKGEEVETLSLGDRSLWQLVPTGNRLFIRPMEYGMQTNMTLITNKHAYQFDLKSVPNEKSKGNIYVARFVYPQDEAKLAAKSAAKMTDMPPAALLAESALNKSVTPTQPQPVFTPPAPNPQASFKPVFQAPKPQIVASSKLLSPNYNYTYTGPDPLAPLKAYDDGESTFIQYRENQPLPSVYMVDADGNMNPVSYNVENNNLIVINRVASEWRLEENNGIVRLYNETLNTK